MVNSLLQMLLLLFRHQQVSWREMTLLSLWNYQMSHLGVWKLISLLLSQQHLEQQVRICYAFYTINDYFNLMSYITSVKLTHIQVIDVSLVTFKWVEEL